MRYFLQRVVVKSASHTWELDHSTRTVLEETDCGHLRPEAEWMEDPKQACHDQHQPFDRVRAQAQISQGRKDLGQKIKKRMDEGR